MYTTSTSNSITQSDMYLAMRQVLGLLFDIPIVQAQQNKNSYFTDNFITMTSIGFKELSTNKLRYNRDDDTETHIRDVEWRCQLDCYGNEAEMIAQTISVIMRSEWACEAFKATGIEIYPLYSSNPINTAFITGEQQYGNRFSVDVHLQPKIEVTVPRVFFDSVKIDLNRVI